MDVINQSKKVFNFNYIYTKRRKGDCSSLIANNSKIKKKLKLNLRIKSLKKILLSSILWEKKLIKLSKKFGTENK